MPTTTISPITATIPAFTVTPTINTPTFPEDIDVYNTELPGVIAGQGTLTSQLNTFITQVGTLEANVIALEASTLGAADIAAANANFKGTWLGGTSYAVPSSVYYNGEYFIALRQNSNQIPNPLAATLDWAPYSIAFQITNATDKTTPVDADVFGFLDSATSMILKKLTWANIKATMKTYTDTLYVALTGAQTVAGVKTFSSNPLSTAVQDTAITALTRKDYVDTKAPLASPTFTGTPAAPTATAGTNTTQIATTSFVIANSSKTTQSTVVNSTGGTSIDFTGLPNGVKKISVMLNGVSVSGTSMLQIQLGDSGGIENTGYDALGWGESGSSRNIVALTSGFPIGISSFYALTALTTGCMIIECISDNSYVSSGLLKNTFPAMLGSAGSKTLSATLDRIRITTVNGTDTFDAGTINISYEV